MKDNKVTTLISIIFSAIMILATVWTMKAMYTGALAAATILFPQMIILLPAMFIFLIIGEVWFNIKAAVWLGKYVTKNDSSNKINSSNIIYSFCTGLAVFLNALANAAITANGAKTCTHALSGFFASIAIMHKSIVEMQTTQCDNEDKSNSTSNDSTEKNTGLSIAIVTTVAAVSAWATIEFLTPIMVAAGASFPVAILPVVLIALVAIAMSSYISANSTIDLKNDVTNTTTTATSDDILKPISNMLQEVYTQLQQFCGIQQNNHR